MATPSDQARSDGDAADSLRSPIARRFVEALRMIEDRGDAEGMAALATDATRWWGVGATGSTTGADGARSFWAGYRRSYAEITSEFTQVIEGTGRVVLEWVGRGRHHSGRPVRYDGVTVLDLDDADEGRVTGVRLYYDTQAALVAAPEDEDPGRAGDDMLDPETAASGENSGLAPQEG